MSVASRVIKNSSLLIIASIVNNLMTFILTLFTARYLGASDFGLISSATSLVGIFGIFCDLGLATYAVREVSRDKSLMSKYFGTVFFLRIMFSLVTCGVYIIFVLASNFSTDGTNVMLLFAVYMFFNSLAFCNFSLFQSNEKMEYQTIGNVIYSVSVLMIILVIIFFRCNVTMVAAGYPIAITLAFLYTMYIVYRHYPRFQVVLTRSFLRELITKGIPFGITSVFTSIYFWIALIILTYTAGSTAVGLFSSSQKLLLVVAAIFTLFSNAIFPIMSELFTNDKEKLTGLYHKLMKYMLIIGLPLATLCSIYSSDIINLIYGSEYVVGSAALTILIWAGVFMLLSNMCSTLLGAINKQSTVTKIAACGACFSFIVNLLMIIRYSYIGAGISTVLTEGLILLLMLITLNRTRYRLHFTECIKPFCQIAVSDLVMVLGIYILNLPFIISCIVALVVYLIALFVTKSINDQDREIILDFINSFRNRM